ncbi:DUF6861 domain-containing protein [Dyella humi]
MSDGMLDSFWSSLQMAEQRVEAEARDAERTLYRTLYGYESRVMRVRWALEASGPLARKEIAGKLQGISLDAIWDILLSIVKDIALYYGGSVVLGTAVGAGVGALFGGVGAVPGAAVGFEAGVVLGDWVMAFLGLKMLAEGLIDTIPQAMRCYVEGFRAAWGPSSSDRPDACYLAGYAPSKETAALRFAQGHVLMIMAILIAIVAYLTRGKSKEALFKAVGDSKRLGSKMADWLKDNEEKLLKEESLQPKVRPRAEAPAETGQPSSSAPRKPKQESATQSTSSSAKPKSLRDQYLGRTPGKNSRTGREVMDRMRDDGMLRENVDTGRTEFFASDEKWYDIKYADMSHQTDAVTWWNQTGREFGAKAPEVRDWMLDSDNYVLDHMSINRSLGAKLGETYLPPLK